MKHLNDGVMKVIVMFKDILELVKHNKRNKAVRRSDVFVEVALNG